MKKKIVILSLAVLIILGVSLYYLALVRPKPPVLISTPSLSIPPLLTPSPQKVTLYLKNKSVISGDLVRETPDETIIWWKGGEVGFKRTEIEHIEYGKIVQEKAGLLFPEEKKEWPYQHDIAIQLTNLAILDTEIVAVLPEKIIIRYPLEEGGSIEQEIDRSKVEILLFRPVENELSNEIKERLRQQFPKMRFYQEGLFTIVTDSPANWVKRYKNVLRSHITDFYFTYFKLLKNRKIKVQNFVVIFYDSYLDYIEYAATDGAPGWLVAGYFNPLDKVLYLPNYLGKEIEELIFEVILEEYRKIIGEAEDWIKKKVDKRYHIFIEGQLDGVKGKLVKIINFAKSYHRTLTYTVLRHEATHELFHNWGLQTIIMSEAKLREDILEEKKKFLQSEDVKEKRKLLKSIWSRLEEITESFEAEADNSWFKEGTATYSETDPIGSVNNHWLYLFQEAGRKDMLLPLEQLTVYTLGSFTGVATEPKFFAYGQSWALTYFLMNNYRDEFMDYLEKVAVQEPKGNEDLLWLLEALGKDLREIEEEFLSYMDQFDEAKNPDFDVKFWDMFYTTFY